MADHGRRGGPTISQRAGSVNGEAMGAYAAGVSGLALRIGVCVAQPTMTEPPRHSRMSLNQATVVPIRQMCGVSSTKAPVCV